MLLTYSTLLTILACLHLSTNAALLQDTKSLVGRDTTPVNPCGASAAGCSCVGTTCTYTYTGTTQQFIMPCKGSISLLAVGAGSNGKPTSGSKVWVESMKMGEGAAAILPQGDAFTIRVGQEGLAYPDCSTKASFNGGGKCATSKQITMNAYGGGGATDIVYYGQNPIQPSFATVMVAAGGAGGQSSSLTTLMASQSANIGHICSKASTVAAKTRYATSSGPMSCAGKGSGAGGGGGGYPSGQAGRISKQISTGGYQGQSFVRGGSYEVPTADMTAEAQITYTCTA